MELTQQANRMRARFPDFTNRVRGTRGGPLSLVSRGRLCPTTMSAEYSIKLEYNGKTRPRLFVLDPELKPREEGGDIPHTYEPNEPCLYFEEWKVGRPIADTIIPWAMLWLNFYESWRVTGEWQGGGIDHGQGNTNT